MLRAIHNRTGRTRENPVLSPLKCVFTLCHAGWDFTKSIRMNVYVMYRGVGVYAGGEWRAASDTPHGSQRI